MVGLFFYFGIMRSLYAIECSTEHTIMATTMFGITLVMTGASRWNYDYWVTTTYIFAAVAPCLELHQTLFRHWAVFTVLPFLCLLHYSALYHQYNLLAYIHYCDVIMGVMASQITSLAIVYSTVFFRRRSKKTWKLRVTGLCAPNSPVTGEFPAQMVSNAENVSIWWCHHDAHIRKTISRL